MRALVLALLLTGCVSTQVNDPASVIRLDEGGIAVIGTGSRIDFGRDRTGVIGTMTRLLGYAPSAIDCIDPSRSAAFWDNNLVLIFQNNAFVGWDALNEALSSGNRARFGQVCISPG